MKIKRRKKPREEIKNTALKNILDKRIKLPNKIRLGVIGIIFFFLIFSAFNANAIDEKPEINIKTTVTFAYSQNGDFDYIIYLTDNMVYDGRTTIKPVDNLIAFRDIVDHIDASFTYNFYSTKTASITGDYILTALIKTDMWSKKFTLASGKFNDSFNEDFSVDYLYYENVTKLINAETGVTASNPQLIIECNIYNLRVKSSEYIFDPDRFIHSMSVSLNENTIDLSDNLKKEMSGVKTTEEKIYSSEGNKEIDQWTANAYFFIIIIIIFSFITKGDVVKLNEIEKQVKKINKKYNEWIVEVDEPPKRPLGTEIINTKSIEDLMKISEELGKPMIYYGSNHEGTHTYYVLDETAHYRYVLYDKEKYIEHLVKNKGKYNKFF